MTQYRLVILAWNRVVFDIYLFQYRLLWDLVIETQNTIQCFARVTTKQWLSKTKARFPKQPLLK